MALPDDLPVLAFESAEAFEAWLAKNHSDPAGIWVRFAKKGSGIESVTYAEAVDIALCWGWIDGQAKAIDDQWYVQRFTQRRARSPWSKRNVAKTEALIAAGRMKPPGMAEIERAQADGRWEAAYAGPRTMEVPEDLQRELDARPEAAAFFATLNSANRYAILWNLQQAKRADTRKRRLEKYVGMLERGEKVH